MVVLMICHVLPTGVDAGAKIALDSDYRALKAQGFDIWVFSYSYTDSGAASDNDYCPGKTTLIPVRPGGRVRRTIRSAFSQFPAAVERFYTDAAEEALRDLLPKARPDIVIVQDVALGGWLPVVHEVWPAARVILRSHGFMQGAGESQTNHASWILKPIFARELHRWTRLERLAVHSCESIWAITQSDADAYRSAYGVANVDYWPVGLDLKRYVELPLSAGDPDAMAHVGTLDSRKAPGLVHFLARCWPELRASNRRARFIVAGRATMRVAFDAEECYYIGRVESDLEVYREVRWSVNAQVMSAGVKLKSLTSMAAGRVLLSTTVGVEGLDVVHGVHYLNYETLAARGALASIWGKNHSTADIAAAGRDWVRRNHSFEEVFDRTADLIKRNLP